ncbi:MAG: dihydropteroate synthase [Bacteroidaceae bacterium]|nr:dihydropteroate synthase [Bacteroidaceae bacterium]
MNSLIQYTINIKGHLLDLSQPHVMGILNVTPDSFFSGSRKQTEQEISERADQILSEGASIIDVGAYSTRPGATFVSEEEEMARMRYGLEIVRRAHPNAIVSIDTFRSSVASMSVNEFGADIINDVSEGEADYTLFRTVAQLNVPYILMSTKPTLRDMMVSFAQKVQQLRDLGVKDIILDPGFGFGKTIEQNFCILSDMEKLRELELPILVGISRKSMIFKTLECTPNESLNGTSVINTISLMKGASILRVHDVKEATEVIKIVNKMEDSCS